MRVYLGDAHSYGCQWVYNEGSSSLNYPTPKGDPIVPDVPISLNVQRAEDLSQRRNRSYLV